MLPPMEHMSEVRGKYVAKLPLWLCESGGSYLTRLSSWTAAWPTTCTHAAKDEDEAEEMLPMTRMIMMMEAGRMEMFVDEHDVVSSRQKTIYGSASSWWQFDYSSAQPKPLPNQRQRMSRTNLSWQKDPFEGSCACAYCSFYPDPASSIHSSEFVEMHTSDLVYIHRHR
jgi:hypothetical protein